MTTEELNEYDALSDREKQLYNLKKSEHPDWSHNQLYVIAKFYCYEPQQLVGAMNPIDLLKQKIKDFFK